jgi:hypothetical protein
LNYKEEEHRLYEHMPFYIEDLRIYSYDVFVGPWN